MSTMSLMRSFAVLAVLGMPLSSAAAATLTADDAVKLALEKNTQVVNAEAGIFDAKSSLYSAYGSILPSLALSYGYDRTRSNNSSRSQIIGNTAVPTPASDVSSRSTSTTLSTNWGLLDLSNWRGVSAARQGMRAARFRRAAARNDVALAARRQFYSVVQAIKLADVAEGALRLARDDERRVKAMFEVGSVSKSDLLKAQVRSAQSEFDVLAARHSVTVQRVALANQMGIKESDLGGVDTLLTVTPQTYDEVQLVAEAARNRPDLIAADADMKAASASHMAARMRRLPYVSASGSVTFDPRFRQDLLDFGVGSSSQSDLDYGASLSLNLDVFNLAAIDAGAASARARRDRARETYDALQRNLASDVHEQLLAYNEASEQNNVAQRGLESATENLKLTQEKYNVGSATILELIDAQVQLQTAQSNVVKALAAIRVAEAQINRVRGLSQ